MAGVCALGMLLFYYTIATKQTQQNRVNNLSDFIVNLLQTLIVLNGSKHRFISYECLRRFGRVSNLAMETYSLYVNPIIGTHNISSCKRERIKDNDKRFTHRLSKSGLKKNWPSLNCMKLIRYTQLCLLQPDKKTYISCYEINRIKYEIRVKSN